MPSLLRIAAAASSMVEGNEGSKPFTFTVSRSGDTTGASSVEWRIIFASTNVEDFAGPTSGMIDFAAEETSKTISIDIQGDVFFEENETFSVFLFNPSMGSSVTISTAVGRILNDDQRINLPPSVGAPLIDQTAKETIPFRYIFPLSTFKDPENQLLIYPATQSDGSPLPSWLSFNGSGRTFSGTPPTDAKDLSIVVTATDVAGLVASDDFNLIVDPAPNRPPRLIAGLPDRSAQEENEFTFTLLASSFSDPEAGTLTYTASMTNNAPLPGWLSFDPETLTFTGTPPLRSADLDIKVTVADPEGLSVSDVFRLITSAGASRRPEIVVPIADQQAVEGTIFNFQFSPGSFVDVDGGNLLYRAALTDGRPLPSWLIFNPSTLTFSGIPPRGAADLEIEVTVRAVSGLTASDVFALTIEDAPNQAPVLARNIVDQSAREGTLFTFQLPADHFRDPNGDPLSYRATLATDEALSALQNELLEDNTEDTEDTEDTGDEPQEPPVEEAQEGEDASGLPSWLIFNPATRIFSGTAPADSSFFDILVIASDPSGSKAFDVFRINTPPPLNRAPALQKPINDISVREGASFTFTPDEGAFADPDGDALVFTARQANNLPLPSWLRFNPATLSFTGVAPLNSENVDVRITARDPAGLTRTEDFRIVTLSPTPPDDLPNTADTTAVLGLQNRVSGAIERVRDLDWVKLTLEEGRLYTISMSAGLSDGLADSVFRLLRFEGGGISEITRVNDGGSAGNARFVFVAPASGAYFLEVGESGNDNVGSYRLQLFQGLDPVQARFPTARTVIDQGVLVRDHQGPLKWAYDFIVAPETAVRAVSDGEVISVVIGGTGGGDPALPAALGSYITIRNDNGLYATYAHFASIDESIAAGARVTQGQTLGLAGLTGTVAATVTTAIVQVHFGLNLLVFDDGLVADGDSLSMSPVVFNANAGVVPAVAAPLGLPRFTDEAEPLPLSGGNEAGPHSDPSFDRYDARGSADDLFLIAVPQHLDLDAVFLR
jgi:murein DD-endopeptidase MepM/ murein hydrolase activator NlpD